MSSVPPHIPPGSSTPPPIPPYDPKAQWRGIHGQQNSAWRTQRNAQKANYANACSPRIPSLVGPILLIGSGIVALLLLTGHIPAGDFWAWYGRWWPLVLIGAGLVLLGEWAFDLRRKIPVHRGGSFVVILVLLAILGFAAAGWSKVGQWHTQFGDQGDDLLNALGLPEHDFDQSVLSAPIPANAAIEIQNPRGDVQITSGIGSSIQVQAHEVAYASSDADAKKIFDAEAAHLTINGSAVLVKSDNSPGQKFGFKSMSSGRLNLTVTVPKSARVTVNAGRGNLTADGLSAGIKITAPHGDVQLGTIAGPVEAHFANGRHDFSAHQIDGSISMDGDLNNLALSEIKGKVTQNGEILGDVRIEKVSGLIHLHTSVTDLELAELPGDLALNSDNLRVTGAKGQVRAVTHSKDVDLSQIYGNSYVENRDGSISIAPVGNYAVEAKNSKGDIEVTLPTNASATINGHARNGDIQTDFGLAVNGEEDKTASGRIGSGTARVVLSTENGDLRIKKSSALFVAPAVPSIQHNRKSPMHPGAPHLKSSRALPPKPVMQ